MTTIAAGQERKKIFPGWWMVGAGVGMQFIFAGAGFYTFGVMFHPLEEYFHAQRATISVAQSLFMLMQGLFGLLSGRLLQTYKAKHLLLAGSLVASLAFFLLSQTRALWQLYLFYALLGAGLGTTGPVLVANVIANWFVRRRGMAMGIAVAGVALGGLTLVRLAERLTNGTPLDWRGTYAVLGLIVLAVNVPLALFVIKTRPQEIGAYPDGDPAPPANTTATVETGYNQPSRHHKQTHKRSRSEWLRSPTFWVMTGGMFMVNIALASVLVHEIRYLEDTGISAATAAAALSFTAGIGIVGKIGFGTLSDKVHVRYVAMFCFAIQAVGVLLLMKAQSMAMVWAFVVVFGISMGGTPALTPLIAADVFGMASYGVIWGAASLFLALSGVIGPTLTGRIYDVTDSYALAFKIFIALLIAGMAATYLAWGLKPTSLRVRKPIPSKEGELKHDRALLSTGDEKGMVRGKQVP